MSTKKLPIPYLYTILIGFAVGVLFALKTFLMYWYWDETDYYVFKKHAVIPIVNYTLWGLLMPIVYYFVSRYRVGSAYPGKENLSAVLASLLLCVLHEVISNIIYYLPMHLLGLTPFTQEVRQFITRAFPYALIDRLIEYWILYAVISGVDFQRKFQEKQLEFVQLQNQLSKAQLSALRLQIQPHFLFNTLNTISSLMEFDIKGSQKIVSKLGSLLRTVLDSDKRNMVPLREELDFIKSYLDIEQVRFQDRLNIHYRVEPETTSCLVPALILQPLVENAVKHGFASNPGPGEIEVCACREGNDLVLGVKDNGCGSSRSLESLMNNGLGLRNVRSRLDLIFKNNYQFKVVTSPGQGFEVELRLPT